MIQHEAMEQEALFDWAAYNVGKYPELRLLYHIPNGGRRDPKEAAFLKRQGVKAGVPDLCLPVARVGYHGLYIEMKYGQNKPTPEQRKWLSALSSQGYMTISDKTPQTRLATANKAISKTLWKMTIFRSDKEAKTHIIRLILTLSTLTIGLRDKGQKKRHRLISK